MNPPVEAVAAMAGAGAAPANIGQRGPPKAVELLVPLWGLPFITQFLRVSLPTLLAPGNVPALAAALPCKFKFLTNLEGADILNSHPGIAFLKGLCDVDVELIDDLITGDNYSTTITLAYARAVLAAGPAMRDTCFFFLISDYIMADGSLRNLLKQMKAGYSGIFAGNYQVVEEDARDVLFRRFESGEPAMSISARDLIAWSFNYLHPMTVANTVNFPLSSSAHSNRLFWRVDDKTMIGRFYLMHMICIRPEVEEFTVGSSCDYSFMPELVPSGNVHVVVDSDEYYVVEMQRRGHERAFLKLGPASRDTLAESLAEWTTERHRLNAHFPVVYHASETSPDLARVVQESRTFIEEIEAGLPPAQPHRDHPYWIGAIAAHRREVARRDRNKAGSLKAQTEAVLEPATGPVPGGFSYADLLHRCREIIFGRLPDVRIWHPRSPDYVMAKALIQQHLNGSEQKVLLLSSAPDVFIKWFDAPGQKVDALSFTKFHQLDVEQLEALQNKYGGCLVIINEAEIRNMRLMIRRINALLTIGSAIVIFSINGQPLTLGQRFSGDFIAAADGFFDLRTPAVTVQYVTAGTLSWMALRGIRYMYELIQRSPIYSMFVGLPAAVLLTLGAMENTFRRTVTVEPQANKICSSIGIVMSVAAHRDDPFGDLKRKENNDSSELDLAGWRFRRYGSDRVIGDQSKAS